MKIESKDTYKLAIFSHVMLMICIIPFLLLKMPVYIPIIFFMSSFVLISLGTIATGRTFIFFEEGIRVAFLFYSRTYSLDELVTQNYISFENSLQYRVINNKGAEFAPFHVHRPSWIGPSLYCHFHPFKYIFVQFENNISYPHNTPHRNDSQYYILHYYETDESTFRSYLANCPNTNIK